MNPVNGFASLVPHQMSPVTGEPCCSNALQLVDTKSAVATYIQQHREQRKSSTLIRTGCIQCLHDGVKCDGENPRCRRGSISEEWRINIDAAARWHGTWRERRGIHTFINFARSPERAGIFESTFWHRLVMQACFYDEAIFHVASGIGALHEFIMKRSSRSGSVDEIGLAFALQQCNRSINLLTGSNDEQRGPRSDPGIPLITCILFAVFEALIGHPTQAIVHALQGRKLLHCCERLASIGQGSNLVDTTSILPVVGGLEIQAKALQGKSMLRSDTSNDPPLPDASPIHDLQHANWTLHYLYIKLLTFSQDTPLDATPCEHAMRMVEKQQMFSPWLKTWEASFANFLYREASALSTHDMNCAKVLKANHIAVTMMANVDHYSRAAWERFNAECRAIIELSVSVLNTYTIVPAATLATFQFPFLTFGLWVSEPLFLVMSRCTDRELQRQAAGLLNGQPRAYQSQRVSRGPKNSRVSNELSLGEPRDTDGWSTDQWIDFTARTRLDAAMATYFGRLPSTYIDRPQYPAISP